MRLTKRQEEARALMAGTQRHNMLYGGSRSGKTYVAVRNLCVRAMRAGNSRHGIFRYRFNACKQSVGLDTLPTVMKNEWPHIWSRCRMDKTDWYLEFPNGSEIWLAGLDDKERVEKVLGKEFVTIYLNECSQIPWHSRNIVLTRLAQKVNYADREGIEQVMKLKAYYDCNPPSQNHWTYKVFQQRIDPVTRLGLDRPENFASIQMNPLHNKVNLAPGYIEELEGLPERDRKRFLDGVFGDDAEGALWTYELLDQQRAESVPDMVRIVVAVDPSGASGKEDERSDEIGITVCGLGTDARGYLLEDLSGKYGPGGENGWGTIAVDAFKRWKADAVVAEVNYGGAMVKFVVQAAGAAASPSFTVPYREVRASRGKHVRAEPVSVLYETDKIRHAGRFEELEDQLCAFRVSGYEGDTSPDRADSAVWGFSHLFPELAATAAQDRGRNPEVVTGKVRGGKLVSSTRQRTPSVVTGRRRRR